MLDKRKMKRMKDVYFVNIRTVGYCSQEAWILKGKQLM